jgi:hypothetical protein
MCACIACQNEKESQKQADEDDKLVPTRALHCRQADADGAQYARQACAPIRFAHSVWCQNMLPFFTSSSQWKLVDKHDKNDIRAPMQKSAGGDRDRENGDES